MKNFFSFNNIVQVCLVSFTILGFALTSFKLPQYGLLVNLIGQVFWINSSYRAWKEANQIGIFINSLILSAVILYGVINYWIL